MPMGVIKFFNEQRGYGFIEPHEEPAERVGYFVHHSQIAQDGYRTLREGMVVSFEVRDGARGTEAVNVREVISTQ